MSQSLTIAAGTYLVQTLSGLYILAILLRFLLQISRADFYNPVCQTIVKITNPALRPLRRIIPSVGGLDISALLLGFIIQMISISLILILHSYGLPDILSLLGWAIVGIFSLILKIYFFSLIAIIILSWVAPHSNNPLALLVQQLVNPIMQPVQRLIPSIGGIDLSPIFIFITINLLELLLIKPIALALNIPQGLMFGI